MTILAVAASVIFAIFQIGSRIQTACAQATVAGLDRTVELLANLLQRLDSLGVDGIHTVIKEHARVIRKRDRQRLARARARRRAKREAVAR